MKSDADKTEAGVKLDDDGYVIGLTYKGAKAAKAGTYGIYAKYYDQGAGTYIHHGMNTDLANDFGAYGFKGYMVGVNYALAKISLQLLNILILTLKTTTLVKNPVTKLSGPKLSSLSNFSEPASLRAILRSPFLYLGIKIIECVILTLL